MADAPRFDAIYDDHKGPVARWVDGVWRGVVRRRLALTLSLLDPLAGRVILNVGCGSGRFCVAFAERGAARVVGIDFSPQMIALAEQAARQRGVAERCEFLTGLFPDVVEQGEFDVCTAMGFFDYVADPVPLVCRMRELTRQVAIMSFPKAVEWRVPFRRLRFWLAGCPLFLYTRAQVESILTQAAFRHVEWIDLGRDSIVVARP